MKRPAPRRRLTPVEIVFLQHNYADRRTEDLATVLKMDVQKVYRAASRLGLKKSDKYLQSVDACRLRRGDNIGAQNRFKPASVPWNKGTHYTAGGRSAETRFKPGMKPSGWKPIGSERVNSEGFLDRKMSDTGYPPHDWVAIHRLNWIAVNGPIPQGMVLAFRDGNRMNPAVENLELITRRELMARNTVHNLPKELVQIVQLRGVLNRAINRKERS